MKKNNKVAIAAVVAVSTLGSAASAAIDTAPILTSIAEGGAAGVAIAGGVILAWVGIRAFKYLRAAL